MEAVLCEFEDEARRYLAHAAKEGRPADQRLLVGLMPAVRADLRRRGVTCESTLPFFDTESHRTIILELENMCRFLQSSFSPPPGSLTARTHQESLIFYSRLFLAHLMVTLEILHRVDQRHPVDRWAACVYRNPSWDRPDPLVRAGERYVGELTRQFAAARQKPCVVIEADAPAGRASPARRGFSWMDALIGRLSLWLYGKLSARPVALVSNLGYEMDRLVQELAARHPRLVWLWLDPSPKEGSFLELKKCLKRFGRMMVRSETGPFLVPLHFLRAARPSSPELDEPFVMALRDQFVRAIQSDPGRFSYRGISMGGLLTAKLQNDIIPYQLDLLRSGRAMLDLLTEWKPRFVLSQTSGDTYAALGELCAERGIPAVLISHGSSVPAKEPEARIEHDYISRRLINSTYPYVALQSPWASQFADQQSVQSRRLVTGPLIWTRLSPDRRPTPEGSGLRSKIVAGRNGRTRIVLHATTPRTRDSHHFYVCEYPDEYLRSVQDVLEAVEEIDDCLLLVRFRPRVQFSAGDLIDLLPKSDRLVLSVEERFSDVLSITDLLVSFYSATVEEAVANRIPVLLYGGQGRYVQLPAQTLSADPPPAPSAVYFSPEKKYLKPAISNILRIHDGRPLDPELIRPHTFRPEELVSFPDRIAAWMRES